MAEPVDCPKCGAVRTDADACTKCGLRTVRMETFAKVRDAKVSPEVKAAWQTAVDNWDDEKRHDAVFQLATSQGALAWLGGHYRAQAKVGDAVAAKRIEKIFKAAEATLFATASERDPGRSKRNSLIALGIAVLVLAGIGAAAYLTADSGKSNAPKPVQTR